MGHTLTTQGQQQTATDRAEKIRHSLRESGYGAVADLALDHQLPAAYAHSR